MNVEQIKSKFINELWTTLDANNDGVIDKNDKTEIKKQNSNSLSIYTKFENALGNVSITQIDYENACENAYNIDDIINNLKKKNALNGNRPVLGLDSTEISEQTYNVIEKRDSQDRLIYEREEDGTEHFYEYNDDGTEKSTIKYADGSVNITIRDKFGRAIYREDSDKKINITYDSDNNDACTHEISYSNGMKSTLKYDDNNDLQEFSSEFKSFNVVGKKCNNEYILHIHNKLTGKTQIYNFDNVAAEPSEKELFFEMLSEIPAEVLYDLAVENPKIYLPNYETERSCMGRDEKNGEYLRIDFHNMEPTQLLHEMGHILDHIYTENDNAYGSFSSNNADFINAFNIGIARFEAAGNKRHEEKWNSDEQKYEVLHSNGKAYCTFNEQEMFAECYHYIMTGDCMSKETIDKYFPEALELVRQYIDDIRNGKYGERNLIK